MSSDFPEGLLEVQYLLEVFFITLSPPKKSHWVSNQRPSKIGLKEKNGDRREEQ